VQPAATMEGRLDNSASPPLPQEPLDARLRAIEDRLNRVHRDVSRLLEHDTLNALIAAALAFVGLGAAVYLYAAGIEDRLANATIRAIGFLWMFGSTLIFCAMLLRKMLLDNKPFRIMGHALGNVEMEVLLKWAKRCFLWSFIVFGGVVALVLIARVLRG